MATGSACEYVTEVMQCQKVFWFSVIKKKKKVPKRKHRFVEKTNKEYKMSELRNIPWKKAYIVIR